MIGKPRLFVLTAALIGLSALAATVPAIAAAGTITAAGASRPETGATADHARAIPDQKTVPASNQGAVPASFQGWSGEVVTACPTCHIRYVNANFKVPSVNCSQS